MSATLLHYLIYFIVVAPFSWVQFVTIEAQKTALDESRARYVLTTRSIILTAFVVAMLLCLMTYALRHEVYNGVLSDLWVMSCTFWIARHLWDDDNWFSRKWQKMKSRWQKLTQRAKNLARRVRPVLTPQPAYG